MINIRKIEKNHLFRIVIENKIIYKSFKNLEKVKQVRNISLFYLKAKEKEYICLEKRNLISTYNKKKIYGIEIRVNK